MDDFLDQMLSTSSWADGSGMNRAAWDATGVMVDAIGQLNGLSKLSTMPLMPLGRTTESQGIGIHGRDHHQCAGSGLVGENLQHLVHKSTLSGQFEKCEPQNNMVAARGSFDESQTQHGESHVSLQTVADGTSMGGSVALQLNLGKSMSTSSQVLASIGSRRCASITGSPSLKSNSFEGDGFQQPLHSLHSSPLIAPTWNQPYVGEVPLLLSTSGQGNRDTYSLHGEEISSEAHSGKRSQDDEESLLRESDQANMTQSLLSGQGYGIQMSLAQNQPMQDVANGAVRTRVRARRGQATDPHSIAERNRRERIAERMKALQELVPDSNKTDKASMLDEIISYVKFLQTQVKCLSMCRLGGAKAAVPLLADLPTEGASNFLAATLGHANGATRSSQDGIAKAERQVARLMDEDMSAAMQYLQSKGLCLMPISLATAISSSGVRQILSPQAAVKDIEARDNEEKTEELTAAAAAMGSHSSAVIATLASNGGAVSGKECATKSGDTPHKSFRDLTRNHLTAEKTNGGSACLPPNQQNLE